MSNYAIDRNQGNGQHDIPFGYIDVGDGGLFFDWKYDADATHYEQVKQVVDTLTEDTEDAPTGRWSYTGVERALRHHIAQHGLV